MSPKKIKVREHYRRVQQPAENRPENRPEEYLRRHGGRAGNVARPTADEMRDTDRKIL